MRFLDNQSLLPQIGSLYGPYADLFAEYFLYMSNRTEYLGLRVYISRDLPLFLSIARQPGLSVYDSKIKEFPEHNGFWIALVDQGERLVGHQANRLMLVEPFNLYEELRDLTFFYDNPRAHASPAEEVIIVEPALSYTKAVHGRIVYAGGLWVSKELRRMRVAQMISFLAHSLACAWWFPDYILALVGLENRAKHKKLTTFDFEIMEPGISWRGPAQAAASGSEDLALFLKSPTYLAKQLRKFLDAG